MSKLIRRQNTKYFYVYQTRDFGGKRSEVLKSKQNNKNKFYSEVFRAEQRQWNRCQVSTLSFFVSYATN